MNKLNNKILLVLITILLITIGTNNLVSGLFFNQEYGKAIEKEMFYIGGGIKQQLERILSLGINMEDIFKFDEICRDVVRKNPEVSYAFVFDRNGNMLFHGDEEKPTITEWNEEEYEQALRSNHESQMEISVDGKDYNSAVVPVVNEMNTVQGAIIISVSNDYIADKTKKLIYYSILQAVLFFATSLILLATILRRWVTSPLHNITTIMNNAGAGNLNVRVNIKSNDEFRLLGNTLNQMLMKIKELMHAQEKATQIQMEYVSEQERSRVSELLRDAMYTLSSTLDVHKVQRFVLEHLKEFVKYDRASLWMYENDRLVMQTWMDVDDSLPEISDADLCSYSERLERGGQSILLECDNQDNFMLVTPLRLRGNLIGIVLLEREGFEFEQNEVDLVLSYISQAIVAMDNAMMYFKMEKMAVTDELTGMYNRRYFYKLVQEEYEVVQMSKEPMAVILFDIDYFKKINDRYGHFAADEVLRGLATIMADTITSYHSIARFGGEEFVLLLAKTNGQGAEQVAETIRKKVSEHTFSTMQGDINISVSLGVAELKREDNVQSFLQRADEALYIAKEDGRNRVVFKRF
ncbi:diguanylate cyclase [Aquibacillus rhizosphaerae]|uniref:Diguanylate cyclase n=1 Tax=Aquibacillus rhizosphaerae TaxID=3051431 RepID=A0ABT7L3Z8_9BACI|nr:diguanylate cyclase [Aquibacillus sp. LR5S19]MDL4840601.1 diguanylate cyclase [Aquibacillus sp. LR5S19]